jgi:hypothetical protein
MSTLSKNTPPKLPVTEAKKATSKPEQTFLFDRENYIWMLGGLALIFLGLFLMSGGKSANPNEFNYAEIYSFRRITLAPVLMMIGFGIEVYAIMKKPKETNATTQQ